MTDGRATFTAPASAHILLDPGSRVLRRLEYLDSRRARLNSRVTQKTRINLRPHHMQDKKPKTHSKQENTNKQNVNSTTATISQH
jgi:hypothetical protein